MAMVNVTARHMEMTKDLKGIAEEKAEKLTRYFNHIKRIDMVFSFDKNFYKAEIIVTGIRRLTLVAQDSDHYPVNALDRAADKMERQLTKLKEKIRNHHVKNAGTKQQEIKTRRAESRETMFMEPSAGLEQDDWY